MVRKTQLDLTLHKAIREVATAEWDACAGSDNPFVSHAFLSCVEDSGSATARTGRQSPFNTSTSAMLSAGSTTDGRRTRWGQIGVICNTRKSGWIGMPPAEKA